MTIKFLTCALVSALAIAPLAGAARAAPSTANGRISVASMGQAKWRESLSLSAENVREGLKSIAASDLVETAATPISGSALLERAGCRSS